METFQIHFDEGASASPRPRKNRGRKRKGEKYRVIPTRGCTYFDVIEALRHFPDFQDVSKSLLPPHRIEEEVLILRCRRGADLETIENCLLDAVGNIGIVEISSPMTTVICMNLDGVTTADKLQRAIFKQHNAVVEKSNIRLQLFKDGIMRARLRMTAREAAKIINKQLRVGKSVIYPGKEKRWAPTEESGRSKRAQIRLPVEYAKQLAREELLLCGCFS
uniref:Uncharacterized protein n=1 Tax=Anopheles dirus TaxID=7168 RepID=A0A182NQ41_9DIPT